MKKTKQDKQDKIIEELKELNKKFTFDVKVVEKSSIKNNLMVMVFTIAIVLFAYGLSVQFEWHWAIATGIITCIMGFGVLGVVE